MDVSRDFRKDISIDVRTDVSRDVLADVCIVASCDTATFLNHIVIVNRGSTNKYPKIDTSVPNF